MASGKYNIDPSGAFTEVRKYLRKDFRRPFEHLSVSRYDTVTDVWCSVPSPAPMVCNRRMVFSTLFCTSRSLKIQRPSRPRANQLSPHCRGYSFCSASPSSSSTTTITAPTMSALQTWLEAFHLSTRFFRLRTAATLHNWQRSGTPVVCRLSSPRYH